MSNIGWAFWPGWNDPMGRKDFIFNNLLLFLAWVTTSTFFVGLAEAQNAFALFLAVCMVVGVLYTLILTVVWMNNRLRDGGLASENWRIAVIVLSLVSGIVGCLVLIYCMIKPSEDTVIPRHLEEDNASG